MFRVGQKVVCVDANPIGDGPRCEWLKGEEINEQGIYTIHSTFIWDDSCMVRLCEVKRSKMCLEEWGHDGYGAERFRPLVERKTDISVFTKMLTGKRKNVDA